MPITHTDIYLCWDILRAECLSQCFSLKKQNNSQRKDIDIHKSVKRKRQKNIFRTEKSKCKGPSTKIQTLANERKLTYIKPVKRKNKNSKGVKSKCKMSSTIQTTPHDFGKSFVYIQISHSSSSFPSCTIIPFISQGTKYIQK